MYNWGFCYYWTSESCFCLRLVKIIDFSSKLMTHLSGKPTKANHIAVMSSNSIVDLELLKPLSPSSLVTVVEINWLWSLLRFTIGSRQLHIFFSWISSKTKIFQYQTSVLLNTFHTFSPFQLNYSNIRSSNSKWIIVDLQLVQNFTNITMKQINPHSFRKNHAINIISGRNKKNTSYRFSGKYSYLNIC